MRCSTGPLRMADALGSDPAYHLFRKVMALNLSPELPIPTGINRKSYSAFPNWIRTGLAKSPIRDCG